MRVRGGVTALVLLALIVGVGGYVARTHFGEDAPLRSAADYACEALGERTVRLNAEQMSNAATISAVGIRRNLPDQAIVVALATSLQESKLRNLKDLGRRNDHDSLGLFQQRPSQGWGEPEQILDPRYSAGRFYDTLLRVRGWQSMRVTEAAQRVQRSAYPEAYEKWADEARILTQVLTGRSSGALTCSAEPIPQKAGPVAASQAAERLRLDFGAKTPAMVTNQHMLHLPATDEQHGWQLAHWLVAQAVETGVTTVRFADQEWSAERGQWSATSNVNAQVTAEVLPGS